MIPLVCALFTAILFFYIFYTDEEVEPGEKKSRLEYLYERKEAIYDNLRDLNFEYKAGKFPEGDYHTMRNSLEDEAALVLAEIADLEKPAFTSKPNRKGARI